MFTGVLELGVIVSVVVAEPLEGVNEGEDRIQVKPVLLHEAVRPTLELKPFNPVTVIVEILLLPFLMLSELGDADNEKSGGKALCVVVHAVLE